MERAVPYVWQRTTGTAQNRSPIPKLGAAAQPRCLFRSYPFDSACRGGFQHDGIWRNRGSLSKTAGDRASNFAQHGKFGAIGAWSWSILPQLPGLRGFERRIAAGMGHIATWFADNPAALPGSVKKKRAGEPALRNMLSQQAKARGKQTFSVRRRLSVFQPASSRRICGGCRGRKAAQPEARWRRQGPISASEVPFSSQVPFFVSTMATI